jgi:hypothetical protein
MGPKDGENYLDIVRSEKMIEYNKLHNKISRYSRIIILTLLFPLWVPFVILFGIMDWLLGV